MIFPDCKYNPAMDLADVEQFGYINLRVALESGVVPGSVTINEDAYNMIEDLNSIVGKPGDVFEALRYGESLNQAAANVSSEKEGAD